MAYTVQDEKRLRKLIARNRPNPDFPKPEDFDVTEDDVDEYLYRMNPQRDILQEQKKQLTVMGLMVIVPIGIASLFLDYVPALLVGGIVGVATCLCYHFVSRNMQRRTLQRLEESGVAEYIDAVLSRDPENKPADNI